MDNFNIIVGIFGIIGAIATVIPLYFLYKEKQPRKLEHQNNSNLFIPREVKYERLKKRKRRNYIIISIISIIIFIISGIILSVRLLAPPNNPTATNTTFPTPAPTHWQTILTQTAPYCSKPSQAAWYVIPEATHYSCNASGLIMWQEQPPSPSIYNAEIDLEKVHGRYYDQTKFRLQVQVSFLTPSYPPTFATLGFQTPVKRGVSGGYTLAEVGLGVGQLHTLQSSKVQFSNLKLEVEN